MHEYEYGILVLIMDIYYFFSALEASGPRSVMTVTGIIPHVLILEELCSILIWKWAAC